MTSKRDTQVVEVFDMLVANPGGVTIDQIAAHLGCGRQYARKIVQVLRDMLGDDDSINVPCDPDPADLGGPWLYRLVGTMDEVQAWASNRITDTERRVRTQYAVAASIEKGTDGRTKDGRKARIIKKNLGRLLEDLADLEDTRK